MANPVIILVRPQMGENIGAAARAMMNFGFSELRLVAPRDGWPNPKAADMAVHAKKVLESTKVFETFEEAIADIEYLAVTTARNRDMEKPVTSPRELAQLLCRHTGEGRYLDPVFRRDDIKKAKTAIAFGPERTGLHNEEAALADIIINIPVSPALASINLAQSVVIVCYEFFASSGPKVKKGVAAEPATKGELIKMLEHLEEELDEGGFFPIPEKRPGMVQNIRNMFTRAGLSGQEVRTLRGIIRALTGKTNQRALRAVKQSAKSNKDI